ncbi:MAG: efflux RND transporter permease subunit [Chitinophagales bacterium]|nr:efflux RND transporter permease subunit [Chitinophagaceae bacterium]MCB9065477.1 efflux RND transporter permease subunit [Chitinophagales bacterium]
MKDNYKEFKPSSWSIDNRTAIYIFTILITLMGLMSYINLPKEQFPEIKMAQIVVQTFYPGSSPENMENLVSKPIEKQVKSLTGVKKVTSNSFQDFSIVTVEFNTDIDVTSAKRDVKDAVDRARVDLPQNLPNEPEVNDIDFSEFPILNINISGDYDLNRLKRYADDIQDKVEELREIKEAKMVGALEREIQINVDMYKLVSAGFSFGNIERAVSSENLSSTPGQVSMNNKKRILTIRNEFKDAREIGNLIVKNEHGKALYLKDLAEVKDDFEEQESYARLDGNNVITLQVIKAKGENLIEASDNIQNVIKEMQATVLPTDLKIVTTGDQSDQTRTTVHDLINTIIIGFILVTIILMFFMGTTNALFVAMSVPLSCAIAFLVMPSMGITLNMVVLFSFLLALGIVVDDAIVVIENTHRIFDNGKMPIVKAAKTATGEVFLPVLSGTATTLMPFIPLAFWDGLIGEFMKFLPYTLIITLLASLFVAYIINPVFAVSFMKPENHDESGKQKGWTKTQKVTAVVFGALAAIFYVSQMWGMANFIVFLYLLVLLQRFVLNKAIRTFQTKTWPKFKEFYTRWLQRALNRPGITMLLTLALIIVALVGINIRKPKVDFFPKAEPNFAYVYLTMPVGTDQAYTNEKLLELEGKVNEVLGIDYKAGTTNPIVKSVISNVTVGAVDPTSGEIGNFPNKGRIEVAFVKFSDRHGESTSTYLQKIREAVQAVPGAQVVVDQEGGGPPVSKPILIEITGDNLDTLVATSERLKKYLDNKRIDGVEKLLSDFQADKPELVFDINRERMNNESISTGQVLGALRTAVFGKEISRFRDENDDYPITLRVKKSQRENIDAVRNMPIQFRDMGMGGVIREVPISAFADITYGKTYGGIKRKDLKRIITLQSNLLVGYDLNSVLSSVESELSNFKAPPGISIKMGGQLEEQMETMGFLGTAMLISMMLIFLILVMQFNSFSRTVIIMVEILFSVVGVLLGLAIFGNDVSIVMTGVGIVALAGIVVRNGILLVEFIDVMLKEGMSPYDAIVEAGRTRMTPVLLTAIATTLGLIPLGIGLNMDFATLFSELNPHMYLGGDSVAFWGPLAWSMIYGLLFATFLTLILVPVLMLLSFRFKDWIKRRREKLSASLAD